MKRFIQSIYKRWVRSESDPQGELEDHIGIHFSDVGLTLVHVNKKNNALSFQQLFQEKESNHKSQVSWLKDKVDSHHLRGMVATILLPMSDYQIFLIDKPKVLDSEIKEAVQWQIAGYIEFPIEEAVVDYIELPYKETLEGNPRMYVIVAEKNSIQKKIDCVQLAGLQVNNVDICQNALLKIAFQLDDPEEGQALLHIEDSISHLIIFKDKTLYMMRELDIGLNDLSAFESEKSAIQLYHDLSLEIQRTLDYCSSNLKNAGVTRLLLTPLNKKTPQLLSHLSNLLGLPVREIDFSEIIKDCEKISFTPEKNYTFALGAALEGKRC